jgi:hypothetical protein
VTADEAVAAPVIAPSSPQEFIAHVSALACAGRDEELLAFSDRYGERFFGCFTAAELNRLEALFEGAQAVVDLEAWEARAHGRAPSSTSTAAAQPAAVRR